MNRERITGGQAINMMILFLMGSSVVTGASMKAEQDSWIAVIIAIILTIPVLFIYSRLNKIAPGKNIYDMSYYAFGDIVGAIITLLFSLYCFQLSALSTKHFTEYIQVMTLPKTPQIVNAVCIGTLAYFSVRKGIEVLARCVVLLLPISFFVTFSLIFMTTKYMDFKNIQPILSHDISLIVTEGAAAVVFPFAESVLFISIFSAVKNKSNYFSQYIIAHFLASIILFSLVFVNIMVLGVPFARIMYFPSYETAGIINIGEFLSRIEVLVSGNFVVFGFTKISVCLYVTIKGFAKLFKIKKIKILGAVITFLVVISSQLFFESTMEMFNMINVYNYYAPIFQIALPFALIIALLIKRARLRKNNNEA